MKNKNQKSKQEKIIYTKFLTLPLKAGIASKGGMYPKTHDLMVLLYSLEDLGESVLELSNIVDLNPFAVQYRYESLDFDDEVLDRETLLTEIQTLFDRMMVLIG